MHNSFGGLLKKWFGVRSAGIYSWSQKPREKQRRRSFRPLLEQMEERLAPATTVNVSAAQIIYGESGIAQVTVTSSDGDTPTGSVELTVDSEVPVTQPLTSGTTTFSLPGLTAGTHPLQATYNPTGSFTASSGTGEELVFKAAPTLTLSDGGAGWSYPIPATYTITATVAGIDHVPHASLEGVFPTVDYFSG